MGKFRCTSCNFLFGTEANKIPNVCPNCGETGFIAREKTAEELIGEQ